LLKTLHLPTSQTTLSKDNRPWRALYLPYSIHALPHDSTIRLKLFKRTLIDAANTMQTKGKNTILQL
ncbi:hypothetical protein, partial [Vibrio sp. R-1]|uniref:hypothetical protein n=1 Tax=Vibrio sp. R-1 TaxID=2682542 RepID=UPI002D799305